ncbi:MAG: phosphatase PAP2 family protein [Actinomycetota bacterium]
MARVTTPFPTHGTGQRPMPQRPGYQSFFWSRSTDAVFNVLILGALWAVYAAVRSIRSDVEAEALRNAETVLRLQSYVGLDIERGVQAAFDWAPVLIGANTYYLVHFPLTLLVLAVAFAKDRTEAFVSFRNCLVAVTSAALVIHLLIPLAPPRMLDGFIDASALYGPNPYDFPGSHTANQFAAMPSLHVAWAFLVGHAIHRLALARTIQTAAIMHGLLTVFVVVITGHHFLADVLVALLIVAIVFQVEKRWRAAHPTATSAPAPPPSRSLG